MTLTNEDLKAMLPASIEANRQKYLEWLNYYMPLYEINTKERIATFISNIGVECDNFKKIKEDLYYSAERILEVFPSYFKNSKGIPDINLAKKYAKNPIALGSHVYSNRNGNGNEASQDGDNYRARGLMGVTWKTNYAELSKAVGEDFISNPELLESPKYAVLSACWYFKRFVIDRKIV